MGKTGKILVNSLNFRTSPSKSGAPIKNLTKGDEIIVLETANGWHKIIHHGRTGYIKANSRYVAVYSENGTSTKPLEGLIKKSENITSQIRENKTKLKALTQKEKDVFNSFDGIDIKLNQLQIKTRNIKTEMEGLGERIEKNKASAEALEKKATEHRDYADKRIVALYKIHRLGGMAHVSSSNESLFDLIKQKDSFERILEKDQTRITEYLQSIRKLNALMETQQAQKHELEQLKSELGKQQQMVTVERNKRSRLLSEIQNQRQLELAAQKRLVESSANLDKEIEAITKSVFENAGQRDSDGEKLPKESFVRLKGLLKMPVKGKVISSFGTYKNPRNNITLYRNGIDIQADRGEPIRAISSGKVLFAKWFKGYGNMIIIDHGGHYYSVYANIDELFKQAGDLVEKNEVIATVGDSGSLIGPKLYFEIRYYGKPQNPMDWIRTG